MWNSLKKRFQTLGSIDVTRRALTLGSRDSETGHRAKSFNEYTIQMIILAKGARQLLLNAGTHCRLDAVGFTNTAVQPADEIQVDSAYYEVDTVQAIKRTPGITEYYKCDLTDLSPMSVYAAETPPTPPPYFLDYLDVYFWEMVGAEPWPADETNGGTVTRDITTRFKPPAAYKIDTNGANNMRAYLDIISFVKPATYPFRARTRFRVDSSSVTLYEHPEFMHLWNTAAGALTSRVGRTEKGGHDLCCAYLNGICRNIVDITFDEWHILEVIEVSDTDHYIEYDGVKYGPFKKRTTAMPDKIGYIGSLSSTPNHGQDITWHDEIIVYKKENSYDPVGAIAPTEYIIPYPYSFEDGTLEGVTTNTENGGTIAVSTDQAYEGNHSLKMNTLGGANQKAIGIRTVSTVPDYPVKTRLYAYVDSVLGYGALVLILVRKAAAAMGGIYLNNANLSVDVLRNGGITNDLKTIGLGSWNEFVIEELSDTQFKAFVNGEDLGTFTKDVNGKADDVIFGDGSNTVGQALIYYDLVERVKAI